jgi:hypothetical protein
VECVDPGLSDDVVGLIIFGVVGFVVGVLAIALAIYFGRRANLRRRQNDIGLDVVRQGGVRDDDRDVSASDFGAGYEDGAFLEATLKPHFHRLSLAEAKEVLSDSPPGSFMFVPKSTDVDPHGRVCAVKLSVVYVCPKRLDVHCFSTTYIVVHKFYTVFDTNKGTERTVTSLAKLLQRMGLNRDDSSSTLAPKIRHYSEIPPKSAASHYGVLNDAEIGAIN